MSQMLARARHAKRAKCYAGKIKRRRMNKKKVQIAVVITITTQIAVIMKQNAHETRGASRTADAPHVKTPPSPDFANEEELQL